VPYGTLKNKRIRWGRCASELGHLVCLIRCNDRCVAVRTRVDTRSEANPSVRLCPAGTIYKHGSTGSLSRASTM
jgi:hypothetical protein